MKALVLFGSSSDEYVYAPLTESLQSTCQAECLVVSAHRDPKRLAQVLRERDYHFVVAGAGLAAHLPGVVASQVDCPVIGVPVAAHFSGLDAFLSIVQMPFGVPVTACGSEREKEIAPWVGRVSQYPLESFACFDVVIHPTALQYEYAPARMATPAGLRKKNGKCAWNCVKKCPVRGLPSFWSPNQTKWKTTPNALASYTVIFWTKPRAGNRATL